MDKYHWIAIGYILFWVTVICLVCGAYVMAILIGCRIFLILFIGIIFFWWVKMIGDELRKRAQR